MFSMIAQLRLETKASVLEEVFLCLAEKNGSSIFLRRPFVGFSRLRVRTRFERHEIHSVHRRKFSSLGLYIFKTVSCMVQSDEV